MSSNFIADFVEKKLAEPADQQSHQQDTSEKSLAKGILAGLIGGVLATAAKTVAERLYPPRTHGEPEPTDVLAEKVTGGDLSDTQKTIAAESIHWLFGAAAGAAYGALAEYYPAPPPRATVPISA